MCSCKKNSKRVELKHSTTDTSVKKDTEIKVVKVTKYKTVEVDRSVKELTKKLELN